MDNHIISILQKFEKPHEEFLQDKECLICLEPFDLESNNFAQLPCKCSNSTYHIVCIIKLLHSGANKNFCPHCKTIYEIQLQQIQATGNQIVPYIVVINTQQQEIHNSQIKNYTHILVFHIFSNSIMNFINIYLSRLCVDYNRHEILKILMILYCFKIFFNYFILIYSKNNLDKIEDFLVCSYIFQTVLFGLLIYSSTKIKNDYNSIILLFNNVFFNFGDLTFRVITEYKMRNTVNVIG
jgi:hypothetical protein